MSISICDTLTDRNNITAANRLEGRTVWVISTGKYYVWVGPAATGQWVEQPTLAAVTALQTALATVQGQIATLQASDASQSGQLATLQAQANSIQAQLTAASNSINGKGIIAAKTVPSNVTSVTTSSASGAQMAPTADFSITFTVPSSGGVVVWFTTVCIENSGASGLYQVWDGGTLLKEVAVSGPPNASHRTSIPIPLTGLTPGASKTLTMGHRLNAAGGTMTTYLSFVTAGCTVIEVVGN